MAARYVNPSNVVAQGQSFYTGLGDQDQQKSGSGPSISSGTQQMAGTGPGLSSGSYAGHGGGGGTNVMGRGSGGSAGVGADRTGSDSSKSWNYKPQLNIQIARDEEKKRGGPEGEVDPPKPEEGGVNGPNGPPVNPGRGRPRQPQGGALEPYKGPFIPGTTTPKRIRPDWDTAGGLLGGDGGTPNFDAATAPKPLQLGPGTPALGGGSKPMGELNPGPRAPREPSQTPGAIRGRERRAKARDEREAHADFRAAVNPATGTLFGTPHRNVSGPISSGLPTLGTPIGGASGSRTNGRPA